MSSAAPSAPTQLADRLHGVHVNVRRDLEASRHVVRGEPGYVVTDPLTLQSHRFDVGDYQILVSIDATRSLGDIFAEHVASGVLTAEDEERFYQFIVSLHRLDFLNLPISDDQLLYKRYKSRKHAKARSRWLSIMFLQIPIWNPDAYLRRTVHIFGRMFTPLMVILWAALMGGAAMALFARRADLAMPLEELLAPKNLPAMWLTFVLLKLIHEFGHGYACRKFNCAVPEMGVYLILGTPCAYVDATATWMLGNRWKRIVVGLAGMYFESFVAAAAALLWAFTGPGPLHNLAYNVFLLAGVTTVLFNINPLMRYDGYYIFSDLVDVPNLRQRATGYVAEVFKRRVLGVRLPHDDRTLGMRALLLGYGVAATSYRFLITLGIATLIATKLFFVGLALAVAYVGKAVVGAATKLARYLWLADETAPVRGRAIAFGLALLVGVPLGVGAIPIRTALHARAALLGGAETVVRATTGGFADDIRIHRGQHVDSGEVLCRLTNERLEESLLHANAQLRRATIRLAAFEATDAARATLERVRHDSFERDLQYFERAFAELYVTAPHGGRVVESLADHDVGRYFNAGEPVATIVDGEWRIETVLTEEELFAVQPQVGDAIVFRPTAAPLRAIRGVISHVDPAGRTQVEHLSLTTAGGGQIATNPQTHQTLRPYFKVVARLDVADVSLVRRGMTGRVRFAANPEPLALNLARRIMRLTSSIQMQ